MGGELGFTGRIEATRPLEAISMMSQGPEGCGPGAEEVRQKPCVFAGKQLSDRPLIDENAPNSYIVSSSQLRGPRLRLLHFNDVYDVYPPPSGVGGAAHFATAMKEKKEEDADSSCLVFFSGDIFSPSQLSEASQGRQMAYLLNLLDVHTACYGNHDLDYGWEWLEVLAGTTACRWIVSNATMKGDDAHPMANAQKYRIFEWGPHRILTGVVGLIERDWIDVLRHPDREMIVYEDYVQAARKYANMLRERGCQLVIALTHMRWHNDEKLAREVEGIDLILGGHDHEYGTKVVNGRLIVKSGSDFRDFSSLTLFPKNYAADTGFADVPDDLISDSSQYSVATPKKGERGDTAVPHPLKTLRRSGPVRLCEGDFQHSSCLGDGCSAGGKEAVVSSPGRGISNTLAHGVDVRSREFSEDAVQSTAANSEHSSNIWTKSPVPELSPSVERLYSSGRWWALCDRVPVCVDAYAADEEVVEMLDTCARDFGLSRNTSTLGTWPVSVEARFRELRSRDCNCGRWVTDLIRAFADADVGILGAGSLRADCLFQQGDALKAFTLHELLACARELRTVAVPGSLFKAVLENSVSRWPQLEGRFLQVSGLRFVFDGSKPPGERVLEQEIRVLDRQSESWVELDPHKMYKVIGNAFLIDGGDGYTMLSNCEKLAAGKDGVEQDLVRIAELWWERRSLTVYCEEADSDYSVSEKACGMEWLDQVTIEKDSTCNWRIRNLACGSVVDNALTGEQGECEVTCNLKKEGNT